MIEKLETIMEKYRELTAKVVDPNVIADNRLWQKLVKEHSDLTPIAEGYEKLKKCLSNLASAEEMLNTEKDPEMIAYQKKKLNLVKKKKKL